MARPSERLEREPSVTAFLSEFIFSCLLRPRFWFGQNLAPQPQYFLRSKLSARCDVTGGGDARHLLVG